MINKKFNKSKQIIIIGLFIFMLFPALNVKADAIRLNSDEVSVRSDAGTGYINLGRVSTNSTFDYIGSVPTRDSSTKCSSGTWYKISYNSNIGYVCSSFATLVSSATSGTANNTSDAYDRPWITPKKSIVNGAKYIAEYYIKLDGKVDSIVFTAGVGENGIDMRADIMANMDFLGMKLDEEANKVRGKERVISTEDSKVKILLIPTNEELMIARDTLELVK